RHLIPLPSPLTNGMESISSWRASFTVSQGGRERDKVPAEQMREIPEVTRLLDRGKQQGVLTYDEINEALRSEAIDSDQAEDILQNIADEGIQVVEKVGEPAAPAPARTGEEEEASLKDLEIRDEDGGHVEGIPID